MSKILWKEPFCVRTEQLPGQHLSKLLSTHLVSLRAGNTYPDHERGVSISHELAAVPTPPGALPVSRTQFYLEPHRFPTDRRQGPIAKKQYPRPPRTRECATSYRWGAFANDTQAVAQSNL